MVTIRCKNKCDTDMFIVEAEAFICESASCYDIRYEIVDAICEICYGEVEVVDSDRNS